MDKQSILIIGAGAAGLIAARQLSATFNVTVLEAGTCIGGRINSIHIGDTLVEGGAEFIHGQLPLTLQLLKEAQINYVATEGKMYRKKNDGFVVQKDVLSGWDNLMQKMKAVKRDMTLHLFLQKHYSDHTHNYFRSQVKAYAEGFDLADINEVSVRALYKEWSGEEDTNYRITTGYSSLLNYLQVKAIEKGSTILTDKIVSKINWRQNMITATTTKNEIYEANKILLTVPLTTLYKDDAVASIQFNPVINNYSRAAMDIGLGPVIKVVINFKKSFWQSDANFFFSDNVYFPTWWTQLPDTTPTLTGWLGGPKVKDIAKKTDEELQEIALESLSKLFTISIDAINENILFAKVFNWQNKTVAAGGYSYDTIKSQSARDILKTPLFKTIYFAGEALYDGDHPGTVEAALVSGQQAATQIINNP